MITDDIIINADDFGYSKSVNEAICICFKLGYIQRTTIMVNMPAFSDAVKIAKDNDFFEKVGLHLVLDEGEPISFSMKQNHRFCKDGVFIKGWFTNIRNRLFLSATDRKCLRDEISAQMKLYIDAGFPLFHIDSHHLVHTYSPIILKIVIEEAKKNNFQSIRNISIKSGDNIIICHVKKNMSRMISRNFSTTRYFLPFSHFSLNLSSVEYMSHPDLIDDIPVDYYDRKKIRYKPFECVNNLSRLNED